MKSLFSVPIDDVILMASFYGPRISASSG